MVSGGWRGEGMVGGVEGGDGVCGGGIMLMMMVD